MGRTLSSGALLFTAHDALSGAYQYVRIVPHEQYIAAYRSRVLSDYRIQMSCYAVSGYGVHVAVEALRFVARGCIAMIRNDNSVIRDRVDEFLRRAGPIAQQHGIDIYLCVFGIFLGGLDKSSKVYIENIVDEYLWFANAVESGIGRVAFYRGERIKGWQ